MSDKLDQHLDSLLAERPLRAGDDFADRVLAEADARGLTSRGRSRQAVLLRFALPLAAAVALSFAAVQLLHQPGALEKSASALNEAEITEILLLEEGLAGLSGLSLEALDPAAMSPILDTITFGLEES